MPLSMTKIAYTSKTVEQLRAWVERGDEAVMTTRYLPRRHEEMAGGSLYWIMDHTIVARSPIQGFGQAEDGRCLIRLAPCLIAVDPQSQARASGLALSRREERAARSGRWRKPVRRAARQAGGKAQDAGVDLSVRWILSAVRPLTG